jgi:hypothetical protein
MSTDATRFFTDDKFYTGPVLTDDLVKSAEAKLGYRLPPSYLALLAERNGGVPRRRCFRTAAPTSWANDHVEIAAIRGIGGDWGLDSEDGVGSSDMIAEWGYPDIGVVICEMPSAGHDAIMLDYSECGSRGVASMSWLRAIAVLAFVQAAFGRPASASAFLAGAHASSEARVGIPLGVVTPGGGGSITVT